MTTDWITDRLPKEKDGDQQGDVSVRQRPDSPEGIELHWKHVGPSVPWRHSSDWNPSKPSLALGQIWKRADGVVVEITHGSEDFDDHPYYAGNWYSADGKSIVHDLCPGQELVELLPPATLEGRVGVIVYQLKELQNRIQPILDLHNKLTRNS
jgi:hypothetical protein